MGSQILGLLGGLWGDPGANFIDLAGGGDQVFGKKPQVAEYTPTNLSDETGKAIDANLTNFDSITAFLNKVVPGFSDILTKGLQNTQSELSGEIPDDVKAQIMRSSAFSALGGGFAGTPMSKALTARDLGLSSLNLTQMGQNSAQAWTQLAENAYSPWSVSTSQQAAVTAANNAGEQATQQFKYNVAAAPNPSAAGQFNVDAALGQQMLSFGMASVGGGIGGGGGYPSAGVGGQNQSLSLGGSYAYNPQTGQYTQGPFNAAGTGGTGAWGNPTYNYSDARLKHHIRFVRRSPLGYKIYRWMFQGGSQVYLGLIAQQVLRVNPRAIWIDDGGYMRVRYGMTDVQLVRET